MDRRKLLASVAFVIGTLGISAIILKKAVVPQVTVISLKESELSYLVYGTGEICSEHSTVYPLINDLRVKKNDVKVGDEVKAGDILVEFDMEDLEDYLTTLTRKKETIELGIEERTIEKRDYKITYLSGEYELAYAKAIDDYKNSKKELEALKAKQEEVKGQKLLTYKRQKEEEYDELESQCESKKKEKDVLTESQKFQISEQKKMIAKLEKKIASLTKVKTSIDNNTYDSKEIEKELTEKLEDAEIEYESEFKISPDSADTAKAKKKYEALKESYAQDLKDKIQELYEDTAEALEDAQSEHDSLKKEYQLMGKEQEKAQSDIEKEIKAIKENMSSVKLIIDAITKGDYTLEDLKEEQEKEVQAAQEKILEKQYEVKRARLSMQEYVNSVKSENDWRSEDTEKANDVLDVGIEKLQLELDATNESIEELQELIDNEGIIFALGDGTVSQNDGKEGKKTELDSIVKVDSSESEFYAVVPEEDGQFLEIGDKLTISGSGDEETVTCEIERIVPISDNNGGYEVYGIMPDDTDFGLGDSVFYFVEKVSDQVDNCIPIQALRGTEKEPYVFTAVSLDGSGKGKAVIQKCVVKVEDKNEQIAVLGTCENLKETDYIIVTENREVHEGEIVKIIG